MYIVKAQSRIDISPHLWHSPYPLNEPTHPPDTCLLHYAKTTTSGHSCPDFPLNRASEKEASPRPDLAAIGVPDVAARRLLAHQILQVPS
jgi:hypothetical protein